MIYLTALGGSRPDLIFAGLYDSAIQYASRLALSSTGKESHHLYHLSTFIGDLVDNGYSICHEDAVITNPVVIFIDCPDIQTIKFIRKRFNPIKTILILAEHPHYQPRHFLECVNTSEVVIHSYDLPTTSFCKSSLRSISSFVYKSVPCFIKSECNREDKSKTCSSKFTSGAYLGSIICSNIVCSSEKSLYKFRRHLISLNAAVLQHKFAHFGRNWIGPNNVTPRIISSNILRSTREKLYKYPQTRLTSFKGTPKDKSVLLDCKTTYSVENFLEPTGYTTEKSLEPLVYGCLPIYVGHSGKNWLRQFLPNYAPDSLKLLSTVLLKSEMDKQDIYEEAMLIRLAINDYIQQEASTSWHLLFDYILNL